MMMPGMSGMHLFRRMKELYPDISVIFVTAVAEVNTAVENMKSGAYDYIVKPVRLDHLRHVVGEVLRNRSPENRHGKVVNEREPDEIPGVAKLSLPGPATPEAESTKPPNGLSLAAPRTEAYKVNIQEDSGTAGSDIELIITPPPEGHLLLSLCRWLEREANAEIEEMKGSAAGPTSLRIFTKHDVPLVEMLGALDEVGSIDVEPDAGEETNTPRFIKRRRDTRGQAPGPLQRYRLVLKPASRVLSSNDQWPAAQLPLPIQ